MKITRIQAQNFIGLRSLDVPLTAPVAVFAGKNGAGKSSIRDAIRFAFLGEPGRVHLKRDHGDLVTFGAKVGKVTISTDEGEWSAKLKDSSARPETPDALPYVLDAQRFAGLDAKARRVFLASMLGVSAKPEEIKAMVAERGCSMTLFDQIRPMLRGGFDAAHEDCKRRASEAKGAWKAITGETWGSAKGEDWTPDRPAGEDPDALTAQADDMRVALDNLDDAIAKAMSRAEAAKATEQMRDLAGRAGEISDQADELAGRLAALRETESQLREVASGAGGQISDFTCPHCGEASRIRIDRGQVVVVPPDQTDPVVDDSQLRAVRDDIAHVEHELEAARRQLAQAQHAAEAIENAETAGSGEGEAADADALKAERARKQADYEALRGEVRSIEAARQAEAGARAAHEEITAWLQLADAFAPDGIPGELLARTIKPINDRLRESADVTRWPQVTIDAAMTIAADGRRYELLSESEQWRADAVVAEAIAHLSGLRLMVLDRMDVLDIASRTACLRWLAGIGGKDHDTIIVMATLKSALRGFHKRVEGFWMQDGRLDDEGRAAA